MGNAAQLFGGIAPSSWSSCHRAHQMSDDPEVLRTLFTRKGYAGSNATVTSVGYTHYANTNEGRFAGALFRVRNTTEAPIRWSVNHYYTAYQSWGDCASASLNGNNAWESSGNRGPGSNQQVHFDLPANQTSTVIFISGSYYWTSYGNTYHRKLDLAFYNDSLALPEGLQFVDDLGGLE